MNTSHTSRSVMVGIDGSDAAIRAAEWAIDEAVSREVPLRLVHVIHERVEPAAFASVGNVQMEVEYGETALSTACAAMEATGKAVKVETDILRGDPAAVLIAESRRADMVCVGSVGIGRFARALLGSTAAELAKAAHCSVAIIRTKPRQLKLASDCIVVAVNNSSENEAVVQQAMKEAQLRDAPVLALGGWREDLGDMTLDDVNRRLESWRLRCPSVQIYTAATHTNIADFLGVNGRRVQLAVIGSSDVDQVVQLIGPHRQPLLGHAECSVLVVRC
ncbi:universal stress protein [Mycobacterium noviomagense]|uniref:UspA domain-containing protein n=2 Tax=Mycobacterium noviomagense TaxID=459858 RepID=A0ABX3T8L2_9MYCO|nr:universal stress protein [Mycobacterium noviomagense]ORB16865.1 hypothetical protein BST37_06165 [Mycobacterium noviomagense]